MQPWELDWSKPAAQPAGAGAAPPWERKWDAPDGRAPKPDGQMVSGFKRSFEELPGLAAGVGAFGADLVGATETRDALLGYAQRKNDEVAQAHQGDAQSITDTWDGKTGWLDFLANASGYVAGQALQSLATGGLGVIGAKMLAKQGIKELAEVTAAKAIAGGASEEAAHAAVANALAQAAEKAVGRGAVAGAGAHNFGMELGSIYPDAIEEAGGADKLDGGDKFRVLAAASLAAGVDTAGEAIMASRVFKGSKAGAGATTPPGLLGRAAREVPAGMVREAGTEAVQTALEHYGAGQPIADEKGLKDIIDSAGVGAVGGGLGGALASRKARHPTDHTAAVQDVLQAPTLDEALAAASAATEPDATAIKPRKANEAAITEIRQLDPEDQAEAIGLHATAANPNASDTVRRFAQNRLDELLLPVRQIPTGEATDLPVVQPSTTRGLGELRQADYDAQRAAEAGQWPDGVIPTGEVSEAIPTGEATEMPRRPIPVGKATELTPDLIEPQAPPAPEAGMAPRRNTDGQALDFNAADHFNTPHSVFNYVQRMAGVNTPAARAFVHDYRAGWITNDDVLGLLVKSKPAEPTADERIAAAAAQAPKPQAVQPGDLLTADGMPYGSKTAATIRARKEEGRLVEVLGGWVVRKESTGEQPNVAVPAAVSVPAADAVGDQLGGSGAAVRPVVDAGGAGSVQTGVPTVAAGGSTNEPAGAGGQRDDALSPHQVPVKQEARAIAGESPATPESGAAASSKDHLWNLTREQYFNDPARVRRDTVGNATKASGWRVNYEYTNPAGAGPYKGSVIVAKKPAVGDTIAATFGQARVLSVSAAKPGAAVIDNGEMLDLGRAHHKRAVSDAIAAGKSVPAEVLADYPDLKPALSLADKINARKASKAAAPAVQPPAQAGAREAAAPAERYAAGNALTKEQRRQVLGTLVDVYKAKGAPREQKGIGRDGNERSGYVHSPELFEKSDITGAMVRYYVTLPDKRIAHPSELFPDYTQSDIDAAIAKQASDERTDREEQARWADQAERFGKPTATESAAAWMARNGSGGNPLRDWRTGQQYTLVTLQKGGKFYSVRNDDAALIGRLERAGWAAQAVPHETPAPTLAERVQARKDEKAAPAAAPAPSAATNNPPAAVSPSSTGAESGIEDKPGPDQPEASRAAKPARDEAVIDLRKRLSVLESLRKCLG